MIIINLQAENKRLREKVSNLEDKVTSLKLNQKTSLGSMAEETVLKYLVFLTQLKITA